MAELQTITDGAITGVYHAYYSKKHAASLHHPYYPYVYTSLDDPHVNMEVTDLIREHHGEDEDIPFEHNVGPRG